MLVEAVYETTSAAAMKHLVQPNASMFQSETRERLLELRRRHLNLRIGRADALKQLALFSAKWNDDRVRFQLCIEAVLLIEPQIRLTGRRVGSVAFEAMIRKNGAHIAIKIDDRVQSMDGLLANRRLNQSESTYPRRDWNANESFSVHNNTIITWTTMICFKPAVAWASSPRQEVGRNKSLANHVLTWIVGDAVPAHPAIPIAGTARTCLLELINTTSRLFRPTTVLNQKSKQ